MASRASLNKVLLIGNLTRDPELRYTPSGAAVCTFAVATNRYYVASDGTKKEETEFIKIVSWNKLAELCSQLLSKGRKVYVEGRLQTRSWEAPDGQNRQTTEVVIDDMRILDSRKDMEATSVEAVDVELPREGTAVEAVAEKPKPSTGGDKIEDKKPKEKTPAEKGSKDKGDADKSNENKDEEVDIDDLPF